MFGFFRKSKQPITSAENLSCLGVDMHSHLLPGIDDGSPDVETSIRLIRGMMQNGYRKFITTPHVYPDLYPNTKETILKAHALLNEHLKEAQLDVEIVPAAEYFIDEQFVDLIDQKDQLLPIHQNWILVEISFLAPPQEFSQVLFKLFTEGYQPVLAHPERYSYYHHQKEKYHQLKDQGCLLQVNLLSLLGYYGKNVQVIARYLVKEQLVDLIGSDLHHDRHLEAMAHPSLWAEVNRIMKSGSILNPTL